MENGGPTDQLAQKAQPEDETSLGTIRKIIHVDMDAYYASIEQRDNPELRGVPVAVGGIQRGVVAAASYEARRFGVRSAMPSTRALRLCPGLVFVKPRFDVYRAVSRQIREIFDSYTPLVEPLSLDEAYLDVTDHLSPGQTATEIAREIRARIRQTTGLTASAGVSYNKFLAKLASDQNKPDGLCVIPPERGPEFVLNLPVGKFHGIGPATAAKMQAMDIHTGADLRQQELELLTRRFGKSGRYYWNISRGIDHRSVSPDRTRKSIGAENTYFADLMTLDEAHEALAALAEKVWRHLSRNELQGRTLTVKVKFSDFRQVTRARTLPHAVRDEAEMLALARDLAATVLPDPRGARLLGITISGFEAEAEDQGVQLSLF